MKVFFQDKSESRILPFQTLDYAPHLHSALEIGFLEKGRSILRVEGECYPVEAGELFAVFPNLIHSYEASEGAEGYLAILAWEDLAPFHALLTERIPTLPVLPRAIWDQAGDLSLLFSLAAKESGLFERDVKRGYARVLAGKLLPLFSLKRKDKESVGTLREILDYLSAHYTEPVSRKSLARALGISESTVSHVFSGALKTSFPAHLKALRLQEALRLLEETELSVTQIAIRSGFGSLRSFNRAFQEELGSSPAAHRGRRG
ncbi:MAG: helix-turn-helix transcriptional regulator [Clostridia bacterium]|nr:helix-turn-helix transcriptional regulator [Clostridia bacterium]